jgi:acetolactate synthase-1/2/3 large subunit
MNTLEINDKKEKELVAVATEELSGSQILLKGLIEEGVDTIFGYPGGAIMPIYDALYDFKEEL